MKCVSITNVQVHRVKTDSETAITGNCHCELCNTFYEFSKVTTKPL